MAGLKVTGRFRGDHYPGDNTYDVYVTEPGQFQVPGPNWMNTLTPSELANLTRELHPRLVDGSSILIVGVTCPGVVVEILERYGFVVTSHRTERDNDGRTIKMECKMMKYGDTLTTDVSY